MGHCPAPLQEVPQPSWVGLVVEPGRALGSVAPDVLPFLQHQFAMWTSGGVPTSPDVRYGADSPPATESGQCVAVPP